MFLDKLINFDYKLFFDINGAYSNFWDPIMVTLSAAKPWIPLYLIVAFLFFCKYSYSSQSNIKLCAEPIEGNRKILWITGISCILAAGLAFGISDQLSVIIKNNVLRLRPTHRFGLYEIHALNGMGGPFGFVSSHATNVFSFALLTSLIFKRIPYSIFIFIWAAAVSYSRIYVGRHFPLDVLGGMVLGLLIACIVYYLLKIVLNHVILYRQKH
ncbi:MAG: phosphatase PAP2 family protein [Bacteroidales bacterium]